MSIEMAIILGFLLHILGDYFIQNDWMAGNKMKNSSVCLLHVATYSLPFLWVVDPIWCFLFVFLTHFFIDRFSLAGYIIRFKNRNWNKDHMLGFRPEVPDPLKWIVYVAVDNGLHLFFNTLAIWLSFQ